MGTEFVKVMYSNNKCLDVCLFSIEALNVCFNYPIFLTGLQRLSSVVVVTTLMSSCDGINDPIRKTCEVVDAAIDNLPMYLLI